MRVRRCPTRCGSRRVRARQRRLALGQAALPTATGPHRSPRRSRTTRRRRLTMLSKILVPLDGGDIAAGVLPAALALARATHASLCLLTVVDEDAAAQRASAEANLSFIAAGLRAEGVPAEVVVRAGSAATEITGGAAAAGADLIAMATHGRSGPARASLGSVAQHVVKESPVP